MRRVFVPRLGAGKDAAAARRMLGLALVTEGHSRGDAARVAGMDRQTLRDWVHRYNESALAGLHNAPERGRPPRKLTPEQEATIAAWVRRGPTPEHKVVRWRCIDLRDEIAREFGVQLHERTVGKLLARLNFAHVSVRPRHPEQDVAAQEAHKKISPRWSPLKLKLPRFGGHPACFRERCPHAENPPPILT